MDLIIEDKDVLFTTLFKHLEDIETHPSDKLFDTDLLKRAERALDASCPQALLWRVLNTGEALLESIRQDPSPLTRLLERTVSLIPFDDLKTVISSQKLIAGLTSPSTAVQLLCLAYLRKASDTPSGASYVACSPDLVHTLVRLWLSSSSTEVSERSLEVIIALLAVDTPGAITIVAGVGVHSSSNSHSGSAIGEAEGQGLMWRRLFQDGDIYSLFFAWTSLTNRSSHDLSTKQGQQAVTISQARLFDFISRVATLDWAAITTSSLPEVERQYQASESESEQHSEQPYSGLLKYAATSMIDREDFLMEVLRRDFFGKLLAVVEEHHPRGVSPRAIAAIQDGAEVAQQNGEISTNGMHL